MIMLLMLDSNSPTCVSSAQRKAKNQKGQSIGCMCSKLLGVRVANCRAYM